MTDEIIRKIDRDVRDILSLASELQDLARAEDAGAPWRSGSGDVPVSGGGVSDPTFSAVADTHKYRGRDRIAESLAAVAVRLRKELARQRPTRSGVCVTERCKGDGFFDGYCDRCDVWRRNNPGLDPAHIRDPETGRGLVDDWNDRLPQFCECPPSCCEECHDGKERGRSVSGRCKQRMARNPERRSA